MDPSDVSHDADHSTYAPHTDGLGSEQTLGVAEPPPVPTLTGLSPASIVVATPTPVTVTGTDLISGSVIVVDGDDQLTTWVDSTTLLYTGQGDTAGSQEVTVRTSSGVSNALTLTLTASRSRARKEA